MEEVKCCLLGFNSELLEQALHPSSSAATAGASSAGAAVATTTACPFRLCCQSLPFHPTEQAFLEQVLPLGHSYRVLRHAAQEVAVGRANGLYPAAIGSGIQKILEHYVAAVRTASTPSALAALPGIYAVTFTLLEQIVASQHHVEVCLPLLDRFLYHQEVPAAFRRLLGESVWMAILYTTAHYVAHGVVLHARPDFFVSLQTRSPPSGAAAATAATGAAAWTSPVAVRTSVGASSVAQPGGSSAEEHTLYVDRLPRGVSTDLALLILAAGKERRVLLRDADMQGGSDYLEQLALGSQDEAANAVFHSIFNVQLCHGGVLATAELTARVEAAKALWSKALWMKVGDLPVLREHLAVLRNVFLCHRGDIWYAFVERVLPVLAGAHPHEQHRRKSASAATASLLSVTPALGNEEDTPADVSGEDEEEEEEAEVGDDGADDAAQRRVAAARRAALQRAAADAFLFALSISNLRDAAAYETLTMRVSASGLEQADAAFAKGGADRDGTATRPTSMDKIDKQGSCRKRGSQRGAASTEDMAKHLLYLVKSMYVQYVPPQGLPLIVSSKSMHYYQRLLSFHLSLRFALQALAVTRTLFSEALLTNTKPSADLRRAFTLFHLLHYLESTVAYYIQVDVISVSTARLEEQLSSSACASVEQAKRLHDQFIWSVSEASFLTDGSEALLQACQSLNTCAVTLYTMCTRYRIPYWAVEGINETPLEVRATLSALEMRVQQDVVAVFTGHLGLGGRPWERALWGRLDFNKYFSQHRTRLAVPTQLRSGSTSAAVFAQPGGFATAAAAAAPVAHVSAIATSTAATRARSSGLAERAGGAGRATTPRHVRTSSKHAGGE
ncbi:Gamma tubulin complex component C-terminal [Lotmaria passim]